MSEEYENGTPPAEEIYEVVDQPRRNNSVLIIVIVALIVLCCCCFIAGAGAWFFGDAVIDFLQF